VSPFPVEPARATGPMRLVLSAYPTAAAARRAAEGAVERRLAACASALVQRSTYLWNGRRETADEVLVVFKTAPKTVGALFRYLAARHPYKVPEIAEVDVLRVEPSYLAWLSGLVDPSSARAPGLAPRRPAGRRGREARAPARTRAPPRRPSRRSRTRR
jgi:periplasmic divalent cation tolerance protein